MSKNLLIDLIILLGTLLVAAMGILGSDPGELYSLGLLLMIAILRRKYRQPSVNHVCALTVFIITTLFSLIQLHAVLAFDFVLRSCVIALVFGVKAAILLWIGISIYRRLINSRVI